MILFAHPHVTRTQHILATRRGARAALARLVTHAPPRPTEPSVVPYLSDAVVAHAWAAAEFVAAAAGEPADPHGVVGRLPDALVDAAISAWSADEHLFDTADITAAWHTCQWLSEAWEEVGAYGWTDVICAHQAWAAIEDLGSRLHRAAAARRDPQPRVI